MTFLRPEALWALTLLVPFSVLEAASILRGGKLARRFAPGDEAELCREAWVRKRILRAAAGAWTWVFTVAALAGPSWGFRPTSGAPTAVEAALVLDVSNSMLSRDLPPSRLSSARDFARALVRSRPEVSYSVTAFKGGAALLSPVTDSPEALDQALEWTVPSAISAPGTSVSEGIRTALEGFSPDPGRARWIILFSDGNDLAGTAAQALRELRDRGVRLVAVGCGGTDPAPALDETGAPVLYPDGKPVRTALKAEVLRAWARDTEGQYLDLADPAALRILADALDARPGHPGSRPAPRPADRTGSAALMALLGAAARALLGLPFLPRRKSRRAAAALLALTILTGCSGPRLRVLEGNRRMIRGQYQDAVTAYLAVGEEAGEGIVALNLATAYSRMGEGAAADPLFGLAQSSVRPEVAAAAYHNQGIRLFEAARFEEAARVFVNALRLVPQDIETKRALELARAAASSSRLSRTSQRQASSIGEGGRDEALLSLLRKAESGWFRPPAPASSDTGGPDH